MSKEEGGREGGGKREEGGGRREEGGGRREGGEGGERGGRREGEREAYVIASRSRIWDRIELCSANTRDVRALI